MVRLEANLATERGLDLALVAAGTGEQRAAELGLDEELSVETVGSRVEGSAWDRGVNCTA